MKKLLVLALVVVALLAGAQLVFSSKAEEAYLQWTQKIEDGGYLSFTDTARSTGLLQSSFSSTMKIIPRNLGGSKSQTYADLEKLNFKLQHQIKHGPFPELMQGNFRPANALIVSTLELTDASRKHLAELFPEGKPLIFTTWVEFSGDSYTQIHSSKFSVKKDNITFTSGGLSGHINFISSQSRIQSEINLPELGLQSTAGEAFALKGLHTSSDLLPDDNGINIGDLAFKLDEFTLAGKAKGSVFNLKLGKLTGDSKTRSKNGKLSNISSMAAQELLVGGKQFGPIAYNIGVGNLDGKTIKAFQEEIKLLEKEDMAAEKKRLLYGKKAADLLSRLLLEAPELDIKNISFYFQDEKFDLNARLRIDPAKITNNADMPPVMTLLQALDLESNISIPKALISAIPQPKPQLSLSGNDAVTAAQAKPGISERMEKFTQQGYFNQDGRYYRSKIVFRQGRLTMNGLAMNPMQAIR